MASRIVNDPKGIVIINNPRRPDVIQPTPPAQPDLSVGQDYWYSDPTFAEQHGIEPLRPAPMNFTVFGFVGGGFALGTPQAQSAACYIGMCNSLLYLQQRTKNPLNRWAATSNLTVQPRAGVDLNAYYDRRSLRFFYKPDAFVPGNMVYTCEASPIVTHELGHAVLDSLRPDFWNTQAMEIHAFHEAFGDCNALIHLTMYGPFLDYVFAQTGGNLRQSNPWSQLAVEMGSAIYKTKRPLRDAFNTFTYVQPETLQWNVPDSQLSPESHNFSRVWTGAFYDLIVSLYEKFMKQGIDQMTALRQGTSIMSKYLLHAIAAAPNTPRLFDALAHAMLAVDQAEGSPYQAEMLAVFSARNIIQDRLMAMDNTKPEDVEGEEVVSQNAVQVFCERKTMTFKLEDKVELVALGDNPLYSVAIEVAADSYYHFANGYLVDKIVPDESEIIDAALSSVNYLHENDLVGPDKAWEVVDGKLVRQHYNCGDAAYVNNSLIKGSPEFGKPWKPQNNAGCCSGCKPQPEPVRKIVKLGCFVRDRSGQSTRSKNCQLTQQRGC